MREERKNNETTQKRAHLTVDNEQLVRKEGTGSGPHINHETVRVLITCTECENVSIIEGCFAKICPSQNTIFSED